MKVLKLTQPLTATEKFIKTYLNTDLNLLKAASTQFLRNNEVYSPKFKGFIA